MFIFIESRSGEGDLKPGRNVKRGETLGGAGSGDGHRESLKRIRERREGHRLELAEFGFEFVPVDQRLDLTFEHLDLRLLDLNVHLGLFQPTSELV